MTEPPPKKRGRPKKIPTVAITPTPVGPPQDATGKAVKTPLTPQPADSLLDMVRSESLHDTDWLNLHRIIKEAGTDYRGEFKIVGGLIWRTSTGSYQLVIPNSIMLKEWVLHASHDDPLCGHLGKDKTLERVQRRFWWRGMAKDVTEWCKCCGTCQMTKSRRHKPYSQLHPLPIPEKRWQVVSLDFVTGLDPSPEGYDALAIFTDKLSKMVHIAPYQFGDSKSETTAQLYIDHVWKLHGAPMQIVCDRDRRLVSAFAKDFHRLLGTQIAATTAWHPQGDGQAENSNRTAVEVLKAYCKDNKKDWCQYLSLVEFAMNDAENKSTGVSPFELNYGEPVRNTLDWILRSQWQEAHESPLAEGKIKSIDEKIHEVRLKLKRAQEYQTKHFNKKVLPEPAYQVGDQVMLSTANLTPVGEQNAKPKLGFKYQGPFTIQKILRTTNGTPHCYELNLPKATHANVHRNFKARYLEPYWTSTKLPSRQAPLASKEVVQQYSDGKREHFVEQVLDDRVVKSGRGKQHREWLIRWQGLPSAENSWVKRDSVSNEYGDNQLWSKYERLRTEQAALRIQRTRNPRRKEKLEEDERTIQRLSTMMSELAPAAEREDQRLDDLLCQQDPLVKQYYEGRKPQFK